MTTSQDSIVGSAPTQGRMVSVVLWRWIRKYRLTRAAKRHFAQFEELRDQWKACAGWDAGGDAMPGWTALTEQQHHEMAALRTTAAAHYRAGMRIYRLLFPNALGERPAGNALPMTPETNEMETPKPVLLDPVVRRRRIIYVPEDYVLALLSRGLVCNQFIRVPEPLGLPETARVVGVWSDWRRNAFGIVVQDPSFDEVPEAIMLPEMQVQWNYVEVAVKSSNHQ